VNLGVAALYKSPTVRELAACVDGDSIDDEPIDLTREASLDQQSSLLQEIDTQLKKPFCSPVLQASSVDFCWHSCCRHDGDDLLSAKGKLARNRGCIISVPRCRNGVCGKTALSDEL
jgi:hypothetical protein